MKKGKRQKPKKKAKRKVATVRIPPETEAKVIRYLRDRTEEEQHNNRKGIVWLGEIEQEQLCSLRVLHAIVARLCKRKWLRPEKFPRRTGAYQILPGLMNYFEVTPDGPHAPNEFWYENRCVARFTPLEFEMLQLAWERRDDPPLVQEVLLEFWLGTNRPRKNFESHKGRINTKFRKNDLPIRLRAANNYLVFSQEPATPEA